MGWEEREDETGKIKLESGKVGPETVARPNISRIVQTYEPKHNNRPI